MSIHAKRRFAFTLIELIAVMTASTVLMLSLASTVVLSTRLLESPPQDTQRWHQWQISDRLSADLRYATSIDESISSGFEVGKPNPTTGLSERATYQADMQGFTRQVGSGPAVSLDPETPSHAFTVDGYSAPTYVSSSNVPRVRSYSIAGSSGHVENLVINPPPGCKDGDLLVLVAVLRTPDYFFVSPSDWTYLDYLYPGSLRMRVMYKTYNSATTGPSVITSWPSAGMSATIVAIENTDSANPILWHDTATGYATASNPGTHPVALESTNMYADQLNLQLLAVDGKPWFDGSLGLPAFTDVVQGTGADGWWSYENSVAIAVRSGPIPNLSTTPRVLHRASGTWAQVAIQIGATP